jgi:iron complex transport system ATP-binding protein
MNAVRVRKLDLDYGRKSVLRQVDFTVEEGEFFLIIGPNGTGKTSLLKALAGLARPSGGSIEILERPLGDYGRKEFSRRVAVVPQHVPVDFPFRVAETVLMGRSPHLRLWEVEREEDKRLAREVMSFTDIAHLAERRLDQLSGGERQRVFIARAICQQPRILLLDEPTAGLDPAHQIKILDLMERLRVEQRVTIIMVSHELNLAAMYGDRLLLLTDGAVASVGSPGEVLTFERLEKSYGCLLLVDENPLGGVPRVMPVPAKFQLRE